MKCTELNSIKQFIQLFISKEESMLDLKIRHEIPAIKHFMNGYRIIEQKAQVLIENEAPKFNLFNILQIYHLESRVHTPFLVELLNPEGRHGQGRLFFDAFLKHLFELNFNADSISDIKVAREYSAYTNGRMDILIIYCEDGIHKEIVIENKIYHHDEKEQLTRYHRHLSQIRMLKQGHFHIVYLTPYKTQPSTESISLSLYEELKQARSLTEWGYYNDIGPVLKSTLEDIKAPVVRHNVMQYIDAIQFL